MAAAGRGGGGGPGRGQQQATGRGRPGPARRMSRPSRRPGFYWLSAAPLSHLVQWEEARTRRDNGIGPCLQQRRGGGKEGHGRGGGGRGVEGRGASGAAGVGGCGSEIETGQGLWFGADL